MDGLAEPMISWKLFLMALAIVSGDVNLPTETTGFEVRDLAKEILFGLEDETDKNNSELLTLYENMMNNEKISSTIKERVKKIHEFYIFI